MTFATSSPITDQSHSFAESVSLRHTACLSNAVPEILGDGIFVLVLLQVERYTFKEGLLADVA